MRPKPMLENLLAAQMERYGVPAARRLDHPGVHAAAYDIERLFELVEHAYLAVHQ